MAVLRKKTGYSIGNCKKALEISNNDVKLAEKWLIEEAQKQGWAKATMLQGRSANQGLIGLHIQKKSAAIVEVGCETDFVARNDKFKDLVKLVANTCYKQFSSRQITENNQLTKYEVSTNDLQELPLDEKKLFDKVALAISNLGENIILKRGSVWVAGEDVELAGAIHPSQPQNQTLVGSFGSIMALRSKRKSRDLNIIGNQLGLHIIGMNPEMLDRIVMKETETESVRKENDKQKDVVNTEVSVEDGFEHEEAAVAEVEENEPALLLQKFMFNEDLTVKELLEENELEVLDFMRYECGEKQTLSVNAE